MNIQKLKIAEQTFLSRYPHGFDDPEMKAIGKKHKMDKMIELTQSAFAKKHFRDTQDIIDNMAKIIGRSSMVSVFEKPKFKDFTRTLTPKEKNRFVDGLKKQLHGDQQEGFEQTLELMKMAKLAKWSLISILPVYFRPQDEIFVKPTTTKSVIATFELDELIYRPQPYWEFYIRYRALLNEMKTQVCPSLSPNSAAFSGFLMMSMNLMTEMN